MKLEKDTYFIHKIMFYRVRTSVTKKANTILNRFVVTKSTQIEQLFDRKYRLIYRVLKLM